VLVIGLDFEAYVLVLARVDVLQVFISSQTTEQSVG
jgi:hypothetical protein